MIKQLEELKNLINIKDDEIKDNIRAILYVDVKLTPQYTDLYSVDFYDNVLEYATIRQQAKIKEIELFYVKEPSIKTTIITNAPDEYNSLMQELKLSSILATLKYRINW